MWSSFLKSSSIKSINPKTRFHFGFAVNKIRIKKNKGLHNLMEWRRRYECSCCSTKMFSPTKTWSIRETIGGHFAAFWRIRVVQEECSPHPGNPAQIKGVGAPDWAVSMFTSNRRRNQTCSYFFLGNSRHRMDRCPEIPKRLRHTLQSTRPDLRILRIF